MAQIVDIIGVGPVEFPDGMSKEQMAEALKKLPKPTQATQPAQPAQPVQQETPPVRATPTAAPTQPQGFNVLEASQAALSRQQTKREAEKTAEPVPVIVWTPLNSASHPAAVVTAVSIQVKESEVPGIIVAIKLPPDEFTVMLPVELLLISYE